jgi:hypothetical protein
MKIKTYSLNTAARERLAAWVYNNHKPANAADLTDEVLLEKARHAAGACGGHCWMCPAHLSDYSTWAIEMANSHANNLGGHGYVELRTFENYSGVNVLISFKEGDYDATEEEDETPDATM